MCTHTAPSFIHRSAPPQWHVYGTLYSRPALHPPYTESPCAFHGCPATSRCHSYALAHIDSKEKPLRERRPFSRSTVITTFTSCYKRVKCHSNARLKNNGRKDQRRPFCCSPEGEEERSASSGRVLLEWVLLWTGSTVSRR